ncbi:unnamed protein product [Linum trigynum]|uniref:Uncharacterized protein n=1 Tax=Linum trigynum TaxID=586398 RepID=A0AAV2C7S6_9ROSI
MQKYATTVFRVLAHTGGDNAKMVDFAYSFFEKQVPIDAVLVKDEMIGFIGVTKESPRLWLGLIRMATITALR